jgi:Zn-dependent protease with chaperone function
VHSEIFWLISGISGAVFCAGFYFEFLWLGWVRLSGYEEYRCERLPREYVLRLAGYDPFEIVRRVAVRAGVLPPELCIVSERRLSAEITGGSNGTAIACGKPFFLRLSEREFEGVVGHEIGHLFGRRWSSYASCSSAGFFASGVFLFIAALIFRDTPAVLMVVEFSSFLSGILSAACSRAVSFFQQKSEYAADRKALSFTRYPWDFVSLLSRLEGYERSCKNMRGTAGIFSLETKTHPPARMRVLSAMRILEERGIKK